MQDETPISPRIEIRASRCRRHALRALALLAGAVGTPTLAGMVQGTALYRERIALPSDAAFEAVLEDVSRADAPARVLGSARLDQAGNPPFRFDWGSAPLSLMRVAAPVGASSTAGAAGADALHLPASWEGKLPGADGTVLWHLDLLPEQRYRLRRTYEGKPAPNRFDEIGSWANAADSPRLDLYVPGSKRVQFLVEADGSLQKLDTGGKPIASGLNDRLERLPEPQLIEPRLKISGLFIYMADAAVITLCADGSRLPVAMEGDFRALQAAYMQARRALGEALLASVEGRIALRPSMEESLPPRDTLVVERFISVSQHGSCGPAPDNRPSRDTAPR
jgi:copper homeostasis protein (lipoprotein)